VCEFWLAGDVITLGAVAGGAKTLVIPVGVRSAERQRNDVVGAGVSVDVLAAVLTGPLIALEHHTAVNVLKRYKHLFSAAACFGDVDVVIRTFLTPLLSWQHVPPTVALAFGKHVETALLLIIQAFLALSLSWHHVAAWMDKAFALCQHVQTVPLRPVQTFLALPLTNRHVAVGVVRATTFSQQVVVALFSP